MHLSTTSSPVQDYYKKIIDLVEVNRTLGNGVHYDPGAIALLATEDKINDNSALEHDARAKYLEMGMERSLAIHFLFKADRDRYRGAITECRHDFLKGRDSYPKTLHEAYAMLKGWTKGNRPHQPS